MQSNIKRTGVYHYGGGYIVIIEGKMIGMWKLKSRAIKKYEELTK